MFSPEQQKAIEEKVGWLKELEGRISHKKLEERIIGTRIAWFKKNKKRVIKEINSEALRTKTDLEKSYYLIFHQWLKDRLCLPEDNGSIFLFEKGKLSRIIIRTKNFCSYLEAMKLEDLNSEKSCKICKDVLEKPVQEVINKYLKEIGSKIKIKFGRDYGCLRCSEPASDYCQEYLTLIKD